MKKKFNKINLASFLSIILVPLSISSAQIGGISGSKLEVPDAEPVEAGRFEFEPTISVFSYSKEFNSLWKSERLKGSIQISSLDFRITLGAMDGLELGTSFSADLQEILLGSKAVMFKGEKTSMALLGGILLPAGNKTADDTSGNTPSVHSFSLGATMSNQLSGKSSVDIYASYSRYVHNIQYDNGLNFGTSFGFWLRDNFQAIIELDGCTAFSRSLYSEKFSVVPGFTYRFSDRLILVLGDQIDLWGKNDLSGNSIFGSFTMSF